MLEVKRRKIIKKLNDVLNNYSELKSLCNLLNNDMDEVIKTINKIIMYAFVDKKFLTNVISLKGLAYSLDNVNNLYSRKYIKTSKDEFLKIESDFPIDSSLVISDLKGLEIPNLETLNKIILDNIEQLSMEEIEKKRLDNKIVNEKAFEETGLFYSRYEHFIIDKNKIYEFEEMESSIEKSYKKLYVSDNYFNGTFIGEDCITNLYNIKADNDINICVMGNVNRIVNGRHRILYILKHFDEEDVPLLVSRRIENKEFNEIILDLIDKKNVEVYKNNILTDNEKILIVYNECAYFIDDFAKLQLFYRLVMNNEVLYSFPNIPFVSTSINDVDTMKKYIEQMYELYMDLGVVFIMEDFEYIILKFPNANYSLLYNAYVAFQQEFTRANVFNYTFDKNVKTKSLK